MKQILTTLAVVFAVVAFSQEDLANNNQATVASKKGPASYTMNTTAEYPGGIKSFYEWAVNEISYPKEARENGVEGTVFVRFTITENGSVTNIEVAKGIGFGCDEEVIRVLKNYPKWNPASMAGNNVKQVQVLPFQFVLHN